MIDDAFIKMILKWRYITEFFVHNEVQIKPNDAKGIEGLSQYIMRNTISLGKMKYEEGEPSGI